MAQLVAIAMDMITQAQRTGASQRRLAGGLCLDLAWCAGYKTLRLSRPSAKPSEHEVTLIRTLFRVPTDAHRTDGDAVIRLQWPA